VALRARLEQQFEEVRAVYDARVKEDFDVIVNEVRALPPAYGHGLGVHRGSRKLGGPDCVAKGLLALFFNTVCCIPWWFGLRGGLAGDSPGCGACGGGGG
jgi:hypothetical protein